MEPGERQHLQCIQIKGLNVGAVVINLLGDVDILACQLISKMFQSSYCKTCYTLYIDYIAQLEVTPPVCISRLSSIRSWLTSNKLASNNGPRVNGGAGGTSISHNWQQGGLAGPSELWGPHMPPLSSRTTTKTILLAFIGKSFAC